MKRFSRPLFLLAPVLAAAALAGCASGGPRHADSHSHAMMDVKEMCAMHKQMMAGKTPAERQAMMNEHMKSASPEMRKHAQIVQEQCK